MNPQRLISILDSLSDEAIGAILVAKATMPNEVFEGILLANAAERDITLASASNDEGVV